MKLPKVPSLVSRSETSKLTEKQNRKVVQRLSVKVAPQGVPGQTCIKTPTGEVCMFMPYPF